MDNHATTVAARPGATAAGLLSELTLQEKVTLLHQYAPAVDRLGLRSFTTGTECLHGLSWSGVATVFPQAVGLASTWDPEFLARVGKAVGTAVSYTHLTLPTNREV